MFHRSIAIAVLCLMVFAPGRASASTLSDAVRGRILLQVQQHGEAWYVNPVDSRRYYMKDGPTAYEMMRTFGLGVSESDYAKIAAGDQTLLSNLMGRIILRVHLHGEAYYLHPEGGVYYLKDGPAAYALMREKSLGITDLDLSKIPIGTLVPKLSADTTHSFSLYTLTNASGSFPVSVIRLKKDAFDLLTDTAETGECSTDCLALSLKTFVDRNNALIGIHGTYFCPPDYPPCEGQVNTFRPPVFNSAAGVMIHEDGLKFHNRPMIASTRDGLLQYFHRAEDFGTSVTQFESTHGAPQGAMGSWPSLVENGVSIAASEPSEPGFLVQSTRGGIGWNNDTIFLVVANNATMVQFASVFVTLGATFAMNLDGGGSVALYEEGQYRVGPGRLLPNAIIFRKR